MRVLASSWGPRIRRCSQAKTLEDAVNRSPRASRLGTVPGMKRGRASLTAAAVAWARGIGTEASAADPTAPVFLPDRAGRIARSAPAVARLVSRVATLGLVDHVNLRTRAIDAAVSRALEHGCHQLVVLGAGLDGRAWRLGGLDDVDVYEVDHPDTQAVKRRRADATASSAAKVVFVAVDFERQSLRARLAEAGHDAERATVWIWEGVTPYLPHKAIELTLADLSERSAPGSRLAMTYAAPPLVPVAWPPLVRSARAAFALLGEPILGVMPPAEAEAMLQAAGFDLLEDSGSAQWGRDLPLARTLGYPFRSERLAVAERALGGG